MRHRRWKAGLVPRRGDVISLALVYALFAWIGWWALIAFPVIVCVDALVEGIGQGVREALRSDR